MQAALMGPGAQSRRGSFCAGLRPARLSQPQGHFRRRVRFHQSRLVEHIAPSDLGYQQTLDAMTRFFQAQGSNASDAAGQAIAWIGQTLQQQVDLLAYIDAFRSLAIIGALMVPIAFTLKSIDLRAPAR